MVLVTGGYLMAYPQARDWAQRKFPDIDFYNFNFTPNIILKRLGGQILNPPSCIGVLYKNEDLVLFITSYALDRTATIYKHKVFRVSEHVLRIRQELFGGMEDELEFLKDLKFVTICDPFRNGLPR